MNAHHNQGIGSLRAEVAGKLLLQGVNFIREAIGSLCCTWLRLQKAGMAWDVRGVNTGLPESRGCVARPFPRATCVVLMVWCAQALCTEEKVHTCTQVLGEVWHAARGGGWDAVCRWPAHASGVRHIPDPTCSLDMLCAGKLHALTSHLSGTYEWQKAWSELLCRSGCRHPEILDKSP